MLLNIVEDASTVPSPQNYDEHIAHLRSERFNPFNKDAHVAASPTGIVMLNSF